MIVGPNGAGKSTCYRKYLRDALKKHIDNHIDPDEIERQIREDLDGEELPNDEFSTMARDEATTQRKIHLGNRVSFSFETVFSDPYGNKLEFMREALAQGYTVVLIAVGLDSAEKSAQRVAVRVTRGGHNVPLDRIRDRYPRVISNIVAGARIASAALIVDNSQDNPDSDGTTYEPFALFVDGLCVRAEEDLPAWWTKYANADQLEPPFSRQVTRLIEQIMSENQSCESQLTLPRLANRKDLH